MHKKASKKMCFLWQYSGIAFFKVIAYNKVRNKQENKKRKGIKKMTIAERLMEIMFEEDMERYNNKQPLRYHTEEEFLDEKEDRENKNV